MTMTIEEIINFMNSQIEQLKGIGTNSFVDGYSLVKKILTEDTPDNLLQKEIKKATNITLVFPNGEDTQDQICLQIKDYPPILFFIINIKFNFYNEANPIKGGVISDVHFTLQEKLNTKLKKLPLIEVLNKIEISYIDNEIDSVLNKIIEAEEVLEKLIEEKNILKQRKEFLLTEQKKISVN